MDVKQFREEIEKTKVKCVLCGHKDYTLAEHLDRAHQISPTAYLKRHPDAVLKSPIVADIQARFERTPITLPKSTGLEKFLAPFLGEDADDYIIADLIDKTSKHFAADSTYPGVAAHIPERDDFFVFDMDRTKALLAGLALRKNTFMEGPTGCGKTQLLLQIFAEMKRPIVRLNLNGEVTPATFRGRMKADPQKGTYFDEGTMPFCMRAGIPLLLDEVDYAPPHVIATMSSVAEAGRSLYIEETGERVVAEDGFMIFATANTGGKGDTRGVYTGTEVLNSAFLDRFGLKMKMEYLSKSEETGMLHRRFPGVPLDQINEVVAIATEVRSSFQRGLLAVTMSTRRLIEYFELSAVVGESESMRLSLLNWVDEDDEQLVHDVITRVTGKPIPVGFKS